MASLLDQAAGLLRARRLSAFDHAFGPVPAHMHRLARRIDLIDGSIGSTVDPASIPIRDRLIITVFQALALYNCLELAFIIFFTFKRRRGLYFWSMMVSTAGTAVNAMAFVVNDSGLTQHRIIPALMIIGGWVPMTTGQAFVLYSRLHLLSLYPSQLRAVLIMILVNAVIGHVPTSIFIFGSNSRNPGPFLVPYSVYEKVEVTVFFLQEMVLSGIYLWKCYGFWRSQRVRAITVARGIIAHLVCVNMLIILLDLTILLLEYSGLYILQTSYKAFVYSVKLKLEITILNRLVEFVRATRRAYNDDRIRQEMEQEWLSTLERNMGVVGRRDLDAQRALNAAGGGAGGANVVVRGAGSHADARTSTPFQVDLSALDEDLALTRPAASYHGEPGDLHTRGEEGEEKPAVTSFEHVKPASSQSDET